MKTPLEQQLRQQWQQYVAEQAEQTTLEFEPQPATARQRFYSPLRPYWLTAAAVVLGVSAVWWVQLTPFEAATDSAFADVATPPPPPPMLLAGDYHLDALERRLQQAYLQGANEAELAQLWAHYHALTQ
ncbi:hypothetical protein SAMN02927930_00439 [Pseudidiomarina indica]|uniref:Uncharacterized protein n=2 Tax=Pseudidiomarina indica TaxID=1159017 RepID=A0A1G6AS83_9GAMM|nr:hypothetical protein SAMN02927930_00439 [Pseudidiomarina indica]